MIQILIVDDDPIYRSLLREILHPDGYRIVEAKDGNEALWMLNHQVFMVPGSGTPDLFIVDFQMAGMNGFELVRQLRSSDETRNIPALMLSGTSRDIVSLVAQEGVSFMPKASPGPAILEKVRALLAQTGKGPAAPPQA